MNKRRVSGMRFKFRFAVAVAGCVLLGVDKVCALDFPGPAPGMAKAHRKGGEITLSNNAMELVWQRSGKTLLPLRLLDKLSNTTLDLSDSECFAIIFDNTPNPAPVTLKASDMALKAAPKVRRVKPDTASLRAGDHCAGYRIDASFRSNDGNIEVDWQATLRDGANYTLQRITMRALRDCREVRCLEMLNMAAPSATVAGVVDGAPVVAGNLFFACDHPRSRNELSTAGTFRRFRCFLPMQARLEPSNPMVAGSLMGVVPQGQLRRGFLHYIERERAVPYRPFLHYNNATETGNPYWQLRRNKEIAPEEAEAFRMSLERIWIKNIHAFGRELTEKRGVTMDSFIHDYGWDDENLVWMFHKGYPNGFTPAREAAARYGVPLGVWISPWGGYPGRAARVDEGARMGFETTPHKYPRLRLGGPRYYARFAETCKSMVRDYGVNTFKFDGIGAGNSQDGPDIYGTDQDALLRLIGELREIKPDIFINATIGTWPSPFWLLHADSIWRQGSDAEKGGKGSVRERWISFRDGKVLERIVQRSPLFPINALMTHGIYVNNIKLGVGATKEKTVPPAITSEVISEIRSYFGSGITLQEMYIEPTRMVPETWDALAEAARWARQNRDVLVDTHWIGGDPFQSEVYGFASWNPRKGIVTLRNSDDKPAAFNLDVAEVFELPPEAPQNYALASPWKEDVGKAPIKVAAGTPRRIELKPFEVLVLDAIPE